MSRVVLDSSALLALINNEKGGEKVEPILSKSLMSAVNVCEVASHLHDIKISGPKIQSLINSLVPNIIDFDEEQSLLAASLKPLTKPLGLSLGDRACLSLAKSLKCPAVTADKIWAKVKSDISVELIR